MRSLPVFFIALLVPLSTSSAAVITVDVNGTGNFTEIQPAIDSAETGDMVTVLPGEYVVTEPITFGGKAITLRSQDGPEQTTIRMSNDPLDPERASVVLFDNGETGASLLEGITLTGGTGSILPGGSAGIFYGGAVLSRDSSPTLRNCTISRNGTSSGPALRGGGLAFLGIASPTVSDCTIVDNAGESGAGLFFDDSSPTITNCDISRNLAQRRVGPGQQGKGGGISFRGEGRPKITDCTISENSAGSGGGGIWLFGAGDKTHLSVTRCTISGNAGGALKLSKSSQDFIDCTISGNDGGGVVLRSNSVLRMTNCEISLNCRSIGGGLYIDAECTLSNCLIWGNLASSLGLCAGCDVGGGGVYVAKKGRIQVTNCTIAGNAGLAGGGIAFEERVESDEPPSTLTNSIVWSNFEGSIAVRAGSRVAVYSSCIDVAKIPWDGNNINDDPRFKNEGVIDFVGFREASAADYVFQVPDFLLELPDYRLRVGSPCIDEGDSEHGLEAGFAGNRRPCGDGVDMGAYESGDCFPMPLRFLRGDCDNDGRVGGSTTDSIVLLRFAFLAGEPPPCLAACDAEANGTIGVADAVRLLRFSFLAQQPPDPPFPECGLTELESDIALGCESPPTACK